MDWMKLRSYSRKRQAQRNVHCPSPLPSVAASAVMGRRNEKAKGPQQCQKLLSKLRWKSRARRQQGNAIPAALPKIQETSEVTQMDCLSVEQSVELNYNENRCVEENIDINETDATVKDSLQLNSASKESPGNNETTSGMTLPTGVSYFLLDCLDVDSTRDSDTEPSDCTSSYSSPEIFRDERDLEGNTASPEGGSPLRCKNSTLLDTSKAINIDRMLHLPNLSKVSGGEVCKILFAKEKTPESQPSGALSLSPAPKRQIDEQQPRKMKGRKKVKFKSILESTTSSSSHVVLGSAERSQPAISPEITDEAFVSKLPGAGMEISSRAVNRGKNKVLLTSTAFLQPEDLECLRNPPEICSIIQASPGFRPLKVIQGPRSRKALFFPPGATEDIITTSKNWAYTNDR
ncbi:meiosis-specific kinetochore protein [Elgaria multicarinata webbii]|uniref:meiosis-specific kinetochore protein n=1 Tax=Elgaria multicarinata webbii TaxID=159646 RepID=UPI002FCD18A8